MTRMGCTVQQHRVRTGVFGGGTLKLFQEIHNGKCNRQSTKEVPSEISQEKVNIAKKNCHSDVHGVFSYGLQHLHFHNVVTREKRSNLKTCSENTHFVSCCFDFIVSAPIKLSVIGDSGSVLSKQLDASPDDAAFIASNCWMAKNGWMKNVKQMHDSQTTNTSMVMLLLGAIQPIEVILVPRTFNLWFHISRGY